MVEMSRLARYLSEATHDARSERTFLLTFVGGTALAVLALAGGVWYVVAAEGVADVLWGIAVMATAILPAVFAVSGVLGLEDARVERKSRTQPEA
jgi:hypothetical protein